MSTLLVRAVALAAITLPVAACYSRVERVSEPAPSAVMVAPTQPTVVPPGAVVVKPY